MDVIKEFYPVGIGKHIVCIYAGLRPPHTNSLSGQAPNPNNFTAV